MLAIAALYVIDGGQFLILAGHCTNDSEYIRDLIRREQERVAPSEALRTALMEGENCGVPQPFVVQAFKARMTELRLSPAAARYGGHKALLIEKKKTPTPHPRCWRHPLTACSRDQSQPSTHCRS